MQPQEYKLFSRFLDRLDEYLHDHGWFINGYYIRRNCKSFEEVEKYLVEHCYELKTSSEIIQKIKTESEQIEEDYERPRQEN